MDELHQLIYKERDVFSARKLDQYYGINNTIHLKIAEKSNNKVLFHYVKELLQKTTIFLILFDPFYQLLDGDDTSHDQHEKIVQWLEKKCIVMLYPFWKIPVSLLKKTGPEAYLKRQLANPIMITVCGYPAN